MLLLDEPTNHLDAESVAWLEHYLSEFKGCVVAVTHDRYFLDNVAGWILELDRGRGFPFEGNYTSWLEQKQARLVLEEKQESKRQKTLKKELEWVRMAPKARATKNKARLERYEQLVAQEYDAREDAADIQIPSGPPLGDLVVKAENLSKAFGAGCRACCKAARPTCSYRCSRCSPSGPSSTSTSWGSLSGSYCLHW